MDRSRPASAKLVLVGLMGAGKSTVAHGLAEALSMRAQDSDHAIEQRAGVSVATIFEREGEPAFRAMEVREVNALLNQAGTAVLSLGGGAFCQPAVREACAEAGAWTIYLHASPDELVQRLQATDLSTRPLLSRDMEATIQSLYAQRDPVYRLADHVEETAGKTPAEVVESLVARFAEVFQ